MSETRVFQSRWGHHACSYETFLMLKALNGAYFRALRQAAAWRRWQRKLPHNRVRRQRIRNAKGQTVGYTPPVPIPEPAFCPIFSQMVQVRRFVDRQGNACPDGYFEAEQRVDPPTVVAAYQRARMPVPDASAVPALGITLDEIHRLHALLGRR